MSRTIKPCSTCGTKCNGSQCRQCYERKSNKRFVANLKPNYHTLVPMGT